MIKKEVRQCVICKRYYIVTHKNQVTCKSKECMRINKINTKKKSQHNWYINKKNKKIKKYDYCPICGVKYIIINNYYKTCGKDYCKKEWIKNRNLLHYRKNRKKYIEYFRMYRKLCTTKKK